MNGINHRPAKEPLSNIAFQAEVKKWLRGNEIVYNFLQKGIPPPKRGIPLRVQKALRHRRHFFRLLDSIKE